MLIEFYKLCFINLINVIFIFNKYDNFHTFLLKKEIRFI